jgi:hypothetical protein
MNKGLIFAGAALLGVVGYFQFKQRGVLVTSGGNAPVVLNVDKSATMIGMVIRKCPEGSSKIGDGIFGPICTTTGLNAALLDGGYYDP